MLLTVLIVYFCLLFLYSRHVAGRGGNAVFYRGERKSSWLLVAYGMIGASLSGVSFVSVPGIVMHSDMCYLQMCLGFIAGYFAVAFILLPIYYRLNLTSIYEVLDRRGNGKNSAERKTASIFFLLSDLLGGGVKFYLVCILLQKFVFDALGIHFLIVVPAMVAGIWLYTRRGGVKTLVHTDALQTTFMLAAAALLVWQLRDAFPQVPESGHLKIFEFADFKSTQNFWKQFISGAFVVIVMTGLNQNMMQKNLTCKSLREAQKNMCLSGFFFVPVNFVFLLLGVLLVLYFQNHGIALPAKSDDLLPLFVAGNGSGITLLLFMLGIVAAAFSSADSALTALTTSTCIDILQKPDNEQIRKRVHIALSGLFVLVVYGLYFCGTGSLLNLVYTLVGYTYGPLLGLFAFALIPQKPSTRPSKFPVILTLCILAPAACFVLDKIAASCLDYKFGYEILILNGALTFASLAIYKKIKG
ncbi:MAG: sodium:solute symporter [Opitutales bacterium]|nr:sodium:solute symporter [Opitutales bacterium]